MAETLSHAGTKRPHTEIEDAPAKKRRIHHALHHVQQRPSNTEPAPQEPIFAQGQLLRSISAALVVAGFSSVKPTALEMLRSHTEEYMLRLLRYVKVSMQGARRTSPTACDFSMALSLMPNASQASLLKPQIDLHIPDEISCPVIEEPLASIPQAPDFAPLLQSLIPKDPPSYIPRHFPKLPPAHAWKQTPVFPEREQDTRKMREKATQEGLMAEQSLRKLAAAAKTGALRAEKRRSTVLSGPGRMRSGRAPKAESLQDVFTEVLKDIGEFDGNEDINMEEPDVAKEEGVDVGMPEGVVVNYDMAHWRHGAGRSALRL